MTSEATPEPHRTDVESTTVVDTPDGAPETVARVRDLLAIQGVAGNPAVLAEAARLLRGVADDLIADSPTRLGDDRAPRPAVVRRAVDFIHTNAQNDITTTEIAAAAGVGTRTLQMAFRRHCGQTPTEYLRGVRLAGAHRDLQAGDSTGSATVAGIAKTWRFHHGGRFSMDYRQVYGHAPSRTLRA